MLDINGDKCPVCGSDRYLNPGLKLLVSPCYHKMCSTCIDRLYTAGPAPCPFCKNVLRKSNFVVQTFEDLFVEREVQVRKRVGKYFNKRIQDFKGDLKAYNDYLEEVEEILFNLIYEVDVDETQARIEVFRRENKEIIATNLQKQTSEDKAIVHRLEMERKEKIMRKELYTAHDASQKLQKQAAAQDIVHLLLESDRPAKEIIAKQKSIIANQSVYEIPDVSFIPDASLEEDVFNEADYASFDPVDTPYEEEFEDLEILDAYVDPWTESYKSEMAQRGGGFTPQFTYTRAIRSAFVGLFEGIA